MPQLPARSGHPSCADVAVRQRHEEHVNFVMRELSHRSKNILSVVQSMAMQVARQSDSFEDFLAGYSSRLCAFAETHDLLIKGDWRGANIRDLIRVHLAPFHNSRENRLDVDGPELKLERIPVMFEHSRHGERSSCILAG
jgi:two-component sensor histidine kinase